VKGKIKKIYIKRSSKKNQKNKDHIEKHDTLQIGIEKLD
jgi:hypothetical protein